MRVEYLESLRLVSLESKCPIPSGS